MLTNEDCFREHYESEKYYASEEYLQGEIEKVESSLEATNKSINSREKTIKCLEIAKNIGKVVMVGGAGLSALIIGNEAVYFGQEYLGDFGTKFGTYANQIHNSLTPHFMASLIAITTAGTSLFYSGQVNQESTTSTINLELEYTDMLESRLYRLDKELIEARDK